MKSVAYIKQTEKIGLKGSSVNPVSRPNILFWNQSYLTELCLTYHKMTGEEDFRNFPGNLVQQFTLLKANKWPLMFNWISFYATEIYYLLH